MTANDPKRTALAMAPRVGLLPITLISLVASGCMAPEKVSSEISPDAPPAYGVGGTMRTVDGMNVWLDGATPPCLFRVLRSATGTYWTGAVSDRGQRERMIMDLAADAAKDGVDGVVVYRESKEITGFVDLLSLRVQKETQPGVSGSNVTYSISSAQIKCLESSGPRVPPPPGKKPSTPPFIRY